MGALERILALAAPCVHETGSGLGSDVWMHRVPLKATFTVEARLLKCSLRRNVLGVAGRLDAKDIGILECCRRERSNCFWHEPFAPMCRRQNVANINRRALHSGLKHPDRDVGVKFGDDIGQTISSLPFFDAGSDEVLRDRFRNVRQPDHEPADVWILGVRTKDCACVGSHRATQAKARGIECFW